RARGARARKIPSRLRASGPRFDASRVPPREERAANGGRGAAPGKSGSSAAFRARATRALLGGRRELFFDDLAAAERDDSTELALRLFEGLLAKHGCHLARVAEQLLRSLAEHGERAADGSRRALAGAHDASGNPRARALHAGERAFGRRLPDRLRDLVHEIGRGRGRLVGRVVQARAVAGVRLHELSNLVEREPCLLERLVELRLRRLLGLEQVHLHAALEVHRAVAARLDGAIDGAGIALGDERLHTVAHARARHAAERLHAQRHRRLVLDDVEDELADFHVAFAAAQIVVVEGRGDLGDLVHVGQVVSVEAARVRERLEPGAQGLVGRPQADAPGEHAELPRAVEPGARAVVLSEERAVGRVEGDLPDVVEDPGGDELDVALGALALEEALELVVAVALRGHRPELADDGDLGLEQRTIDLDLLEHRFRAEQRAQDRAPLVERVVTNLLR